MALWVLFWAFCFPVRASLLVDFGEVLPSAEARSTAEWVMTSGDHQGRPFLLIDKTEARLYLIAADGRLHGFSPVLLGAALGDESVPGIGSRPIAAIRPSERITPAGRFVGEQGHNLDGESLVWLDYDAAVSIHRLRPSPPTERRPARLASPQAEDNRITYGCVNVPVAFYLERIQPLFAAGRAMIYVLPERFDPRGEGRNVD